MRLFIFGKKLLLGMVWLVFVFMLLQGAGYFYFDVLQMDSVTRYGYPAGLFVAQKELDYIYRPGFHGYFTGGDYSAVEIKINEHGFRDDPFSLDKKDGLRVGVLGDSVVFGSGVMQPERFTERLENSDFGKNQKLELYNFGVNSYTFEHYLTLTKMKFFDLKPDWVIVGFTLNDIATKDDDRGPARQVAKTGLSAQGSWVKKIQTSLGRTYAGLFIAELKQRLRMARATAGQQKDYHTVWMKSVDAAWKKPPARARLFAQIMEFDRVAKSQGFRYMFLLFPELNTLLNPAEFGYARTALRAFLEENDIRHCDVYAAFSGYKGDTHELFLHRDSVHFTAAGHSLVADGLQQCLALALK